MAVLGKTEYGSILFSANKFPETQDITHHFLAEYRKNSLDNPKFAEKLKDVILSVKNKIEELRKQRISKDRKDGYKNPDGSPSKKTDYKGYRWSPDKLGFPVSNFPRMSLNQIISIEKAFESFETQNLNKESEEAEPPQQLDYKSEAQKIAWLYRLGITGKILEQCKEGDTIVWRRAANIINSFTGINAETIRKCLMAIHSRGSNNKKNNPLNNPENRLFVAEMAEKFKLNKDK